jgi:epsilon-lactone hydrolase
VRQVSRFGEASRLPDYARYINPARGGWLRALLNLFLWLFVKRSFHWRADIGDLRRKLGKLDRRFGSMDPDVQRTLTSCHGVAAEWIILPNSRAERVLLYLHGGAFIARFPNMYAHLAARCCRALGARALMVDYRLAPEHRYPAAPDDCHAVYRWLLAQGFDARNIVIGGDSAGGNLALASLHRIKAAGEPLPACTVLLSPFVDFTLSSPSLVLNESSDPFFTLAGIAGLRRHYAASESFLEPCASPLFGDFRGLPPMLFQVGSSEMLRDEATRVAAKAHAAGVLVEMEVWDRMPHVFQAFSILPQAAAAIESIVRFIRDCVGWVPVPPHMTCSPGRSPENSDT